jgi:hypothetical protein
MTSIGRGVLSRKSCSAEAASKQEAQPAEKKMIMRGMCAAALKVSFKRADACGVSTAKDGVAVEA